MRKMLDYTAWERAGLAKYKRRDDPFARYCKIFKGGSAFEDEIDDDEVDREAADDNGDTDNGDTSEGAQHISALADLIAEATSGEVSREDALQWLLHDRNGRSLAQAHKRQMKKEKQPMLTFSKIVKDLGIVQVAKGIVLHGRSDGTSITEQELTKAITDHAVRLHPNLRPDAAFAKVYADDTTEAEILRRACQIVKDAALSKSMLLTMPQTSSVGASGTADQTVNSPKAAIEQLQALADEQRRRSPDLTKEQAFSRVYQDPKNAGLAARERRESRLRLIGQT
jgi:hypothetical protein